MLPSLILDLFTTCILRQQMHYNISRLKTSQKFPQKGLSHTRPFSTPNLHPVAKILATPVVNLTICKQLKKVTYHIGGQ